MVWYLIDSYVWNRYTCAIKSPFKKSDKGEPFKRIFTKAFVTSPDNDSDFCSKWIGPMVFSVSEVAWQKHVVTSLSMWYSSVTWGHSAFSSSKYRSKTASEFRESPPPFDPTTTNLLLLSADLLPITPTHGKRF